MKRYYRLLAASTQHIHRRETLDLPALSFSQQRLWVLNQLAPGDPVYNVIRAFHISGPVDASVVEACVNEIVRRHDALRTTIASNDGQPVQIITPASDLEHISSGKLVPLAVIDLRDVPESEREAVLQKHLTEKSRTVFDITRFPLLDTTLLRLGEEDYVFLLVIHHIVSDGWSISVFFQELATLYKAFAKGEASPIPELPIQYADFSDWQREWLQGDVIESQLSYWKEQLGGQLPVLDLPADHPRPAVQTFRGARHGVVLSSKLTTALRQLGQQEGATLFMTLLAAFQTLLYRYSGQSDIIVGSPIANRNQPQIGGLIGFFVNTLALRTKLSDDISFKELLAQVRRVCLGAYTHQNLPFEKLVEELQPDRVLSRSALFQVMFVLQNTPAVISEFSGLKLHPIQVDNGSAKFDMTLTLFERNSGLEGHLEYNLDLFSADTIGRMVGHYQTLLEAIVAAPDSLISRLPILSALECRQLMETWNATQIAYPHDKCVHQMFEAQAKKTPHNVAVVFENQELTYTELNTRANQLAHYLRKLGVGPDVLVGICVERSLEMVVGLLGILKAGGAYMPLDPEYPKDRLSFMLADAQVTVLLTLDRHLERLPEHEGKVVCVDGNWQTIAQESNENPANVATADHLAYIIYTSGSTGKPKGVMIPHKALANYMGWMQSTFPLTVEDRVVQKTPFSFDASIWEFYLPLLAGARLVMARPGGHQDSAYLVKLLEEQHITVLHVVPSLLHVLLEEKEFPGCTSLRRVFCGGEELSVELQERFFSTHGAELYNMYGPTETTITSIFWPCKATDAYRRVPIGRPIANTQIYILDDHLQPVPIGLPGNLYVGGHGLARGYLNRPDLTAEMFIPNPFRTKPGSHLYNSGDRAKYHPDGTITFLGRVDHQVKIRGFRIEPGEIETVLSSQREVAASVVVAREDKPGDKRLVAYVVPDAAYNLDVKAFRIFLKQKLPDYMIPSAFVILDELPLTPNGKIDRLALPAPDQLQPHRESAFTPPRTSFEKLLAEMWGQILGLDAIGVHDDFFELGGHSMLAIQLVAWVRRDFGVELAVREVFEEPTISGLAINILKKKAAQDDDGNMAELLEEIEQLSADEVSGLVEND